MRCHVHKANAKHVQLVSQGQTLGKGLLEKG